MRKTINNSKYLNEIKNAILQHVKINIKDYLILSIILILGVMIGCVIVNNSDENSKQEINGYINSFADTIKNNTYEIDKFKLVKMSMMENIKTVVIIWALGTTLIGIPFTYLLVGYKGMCIGYTISAIISVLGTWNRFNILLSNIIFTEHNYNSNNVNVKCKCN